MSSTVRSVIETFEFQEYRAVVFNTEAVQIFKTDESQPFRWAGKQEDDGFHIATITKISTTMRSMGWLTELIIGCIELYRAPQTIQPLVTTRKGPMTKLIIDFNESRDGESLEIIMSRSDLSRAEKFAILASSVKQNITLNNGELDRLLDTSWRLHDFDADSIHWGKSYYSFLLPIMGLAKSTNSERVGDQLQFENAKHYKNFLSVHQFLTQESAAISLGEFIKNDGFGLQIKNTLEAEILFLLEDKLFILKKISPLLTLTKIELERLLAHFLVFDSLILLDWQVERLKRGIVLKAEKSELSHYDPFPNAGHILSVLEFKELDLYLRKNVESVLNYFAETESKIKIRMMVLSLIADLGVERTEEIIKEISKGQGLYAVRNFSNLLRKNTDLIKLRLLAEPEFSKMPIIFALSLAEIPH